MYQILVVDDVATEVECIQYLVRQHRLRLTMQTAFNGRDALALLKRQPFDILLTDIKMPYMDGLTLAREAKKLDDTISVILFSGYGEFEYAKHAISIGVANYLLKPIVPDEFLLTVRNVMASIQVRPGNVRELGVAPAEAERSRAQMEYGAGGTEETSDADQLIEVIRQGDMAQFHVLFERFVRQIIDRKSLSEIYVKYTMTRIAVELIEYATPDASEQEIVERMFERTGFAGAIDTIRSLATRAEPGPDASGSNHGVEAVKRYIHRHYSDSLSLRELAETFYFSPSYLCHIFKRETGCNLVKYINDFRIKKARELLESTAMKVNAIAAAVGFQSASYFCQLFRDSCGVTPEQYRQIAPTGALTQRRPGK